MGGELGQERERGGREIGRKKRRDSACAQIYVHVYLTVLFQQLL